MPKDREAFLHQFSRGRLLGSYHSYCQYGLGQGELLRQDNAKWQLVEALQHFPAIHNMRYGNESPSGRDVVCRPGTLRAP